MDEFDNMTTEELVLRVQTYCEAKRIVEEAKRDVVYREYLKKYARLLKAELEGKQWA